MFNNETLFIVGAGASAEVAFPVGTQLARKIGAKMDIRFERGFDFVGTGDHGLYSHLTNSQRQNAAEFQPAALRIRDGIPFAQSIDDFLDQHRNDKYINLYGKAAIVQAVVEAERESKLYFKPHEGIETFDADQLTDTWFVKFMYMLSRGVPRDEVTHIFDRVSFVVFNYDRCIEYFLIHALKRTYSIRHEDAEAIVSGLRIIHPYGDVGSFREVPFGATRINCVALSERIKTYTEQAVVAQVIAGIQEAIQRAKHIVFLGFAYHDRNMRLLKPPKEFPTSKRLFGTVFGMSDSDVEVVGHRIDAWFTGRDARSYRSGMIRLENKLKCADLFDNYARSLTGGD
jgi:hypothetical protein